MEKSGFLQRELEFPVFSGYNIAAWMLLFQKYFTWINMHASPNVTVTSFFNFRKDIFIYV